MIRLTIRAMRYTLLPPYIEKALLLRLFRNKGSGALPSLVLDLGLLNKSEEVFFPISSHCGGL